MARLAPSTVDTSTALKLANPLDTGLPEVAANSDALPPETWVEVPPLTLDETVNALLPEKETVPPTTVDLALPAKPPEVKVTAAPVVVEKLPDPELIKSDMPATVIDATEPLIFDWVAADPALCEKSVI